jgi:D-amino-acid oxidase
VLEHRKGVRPRRTGVRLELDVGPGPAIIHNYGHGGAGITLSWGCAEEVGRLAATVAMSPVALAHAPTPH